jgi:hypothetical protein
MKTHGRNTEGNVVKVSLWAGVTLCLMMGLLMSNCSTPSSTQPSQRNFSRTVPEILPKHPGNVFLEGESVSIAAPSGTAKWEATDDRGNAVAGGESSSVSTGKLGIGWYRFSFMDKDGVSIGWTTAAVIAPLTAPTPKDSPVCLDTASAWFARDNPVVQTRFASLAALAGANWTRDRMSWGGMEPAKGAFEEYTTYDTSAEVQAKHGLRILQVSHDTPPWARSPALDGDRAGGRFPRDLRDSYAFCKAMAQRYRGRVLAWEPWNEANVPDFGGHTVDEMCSLQKAAYWGIKRGDPHMTVCWNVLAGPGDDKLSEGVLRNEAWNYFETYNIHTYSPPDTYLKDFEHARGRVRPPHLADRMRDRVAFH